jgi:hypothetical protein
MYVQDTLVSRREIYLVVQDDDDPAAFWICRLVTTKSVGRCLLPVGIVNRRVGTSRRVPANVRGGTGGNYPDLFSSG